VDLSGVLIKMTLLHIFVFALIALIIAWIPSRTWRGWLLFGISVMAVYNLQPEVPLRHFSFWFPTLTIILTFLTWLISGSGRAKFAPMDLRAFALAVGIIVLLDATRWLPAGLPLIADRAPPPASLALVLLAIALLGWFLKRRFGRQGIVSWILIAVVVGFFIVLKWVPVGIEVSRILRSLTGQSRELASMSDLSWIGYSYIAFRLLHALRDGMTGRLPEVDFQAFLTYVLFFPAIIAGPIDRIERFNREYSERPRISAGRLYKGSARILKGCFKKFVLADSLALVALNEINAPLIHGAGWMWLLLYAFSFRLYFDFSGYTDVAIGMGVLMGFNLPENFDQPYLKTDLAAFWNSWHITLAQWFRAYIFNPLTRALRRSELGKNIWIIILAGQLVTMILIGLWHGVTINFALWGLWHAIGLFVHNRWVDFRRTRRLALALGSFSRIEPIIGGLLTFNFVSLGWVWFALPTPELSLLVFQRLFGA
jgi:alginate O-acetyltransferase complex protein AlgI